KPYGQKDLLVKIGSQLDELEDQCKRYVSSAAQSSAPSPLRSPKDGADSALATAGLQHSEDDGAGLTTTTGRVADSSDQTATSASTSTASRFLSIVTSWRESWAEICELMSTSTTSMKSDTTTDL